MRACAHTDTQIDRQTHRETQTHTDTQRDRETHTQTHTPKHTQSQGSWTNRKLEQGRDGGVCAAQPAPVQQLEHRTF